MDTSRRSLVHPAVLVLFFLSGAASLAYEVIWTRQIAVLLGNTVYVVSMVLAAFMAGLAVGSVLLGRWADRRGDPLRIYGVLEILIALYCLCLPWMISQCVPLFRSLYQATGGEGFRLEAVRAGVSLLLLFVPSVLMGGTLPVLARVVAEAPGRYGRDLGGLYAANTFGAVAGCVLTGFVFVPVVGVRATLFGAAALASTVGILAVLLHGPWARQACVREEPPAEGEPIPTDGRLREVFLVGLAVFAVSGFAAMAYEVVWTRVLALFVGPSTYAFTIVVAAFVGGLALGSAIFARAASRFRNPWLALGLVQVLAGVGMLLLMNLVGRVYGSILDIMVLLKHRTMLLYVAEILFAFGFLLVPTVFSGGTFPLVFQTLEAPRRRISGAVGRLYAGNALGAVLGSLAAGFAMIPGLGIRGSLRLAIVLNLALGLGLFLYVLLRNRGEEHRSARRRAVLLLPAGVLFVCLALLLPGWPNGLLIAPPYMVVARNQPTFDRMKGWEILYYNEGVNATVAVLEGPGLRLLSIEGKPDASAWTPSLIQEMRVRGLPLPGVSDMRTQTLLGQIPMFCARNREEILVIGLASGVTIGAIERHPDVGAVNCAEIAPEMEKACRLFSYVSYDALSDPRLRIVYEDGRNHLLMNPGRYDVIVSEPSNPWMPGSAKLFTREAFEAAREALRPGGVMCAWVESYSMQPEVLQSLVRGFVEAFPYAALFHIEDVDYCLVGSNEPLTIREDAWRDRFALPEVAADLGRIRLERWTDLAGLCVATTGSLRRAVSDVPANTDDNGRVEFLSPRTLTTNMVARNRAWIGQCAVDFSELLDPSVPDSTRSLLREKSRRTDSRAHADGTGGG